MKTYRKIWEQYYGNIPIDEDGRTFEIHHIDGNRSNNDINNLMCISIKDHYDIHYKNKDYGACVMIAQRMQLSSDHLSKIQLGVKRPGIGGVKKGTIPWNKGKSGYHLNLTEEGKNKKINSVKNRKNKKLKDSDISFLLYNYKNKIEIENEKIGKVQRNGKVFSYNRAFAHHFSKVFNVSQNYIYYVITKLNV